MTRAPTVSVLLLCWNHAAYLGQCIAALAEQKDRDFEIVFLDNLSTDGSFERARDLFKQHGLSATMLQNDRPQGVSVNLNRLLAASTGELICPLSTDDWYLPRFVEAMRAAAAAHPADWLYGDKATYNEVDGHCEGPHDYVDGDIRAQVLKADFRINMNGAAYRRAALESVGGWSEGIALEDIDLIFRLAEHHRCHRIPEPLCVYRSHPGGISKNIDFMIDGVEQFFATHAAHFRNGGKPATAEAIRQFAARATAQGDYRVAARLLTKALRGDPFNPLMYRTAAYLARRRVGLAA